MPTTTGIAQGAALLPVLPPSQIDRLARHGTRRSVQPGEILAAAGDAPERFFLVLSGEIEVVRQDADGDTLLAVYTAGMFTGEASMLSGRRRLNLIRSRTEAQIAEISRTALLDVIQTDSVLSETIMRAFILRRAELIAHHLGDTVVIGSQYDADTLRIKEFLTRNNHPYAPIDLEREPSVQDTLDHFHIAADDVPVLICRGDVVLRSPSNQTIADCLGFNPAIDDAQVHDVLIVGAGPAGLGAAVYAASEGLDVLVVESNAPGGQAGTSSRIENYLGFPTGISGQDLAASAYAQAEKFGARILVARDAVSLTCDRKPYAVQIAGGPRIPAHTIVIASGASYRKLALDTVARFDGAGIYYGATFVESQICKGDDVIVIGGGNSAGQAAVFLADNARHIHILVRGPNLEDSMSRYLIRRIERHPAITLHTHTEICGLDGEQHLERVHWRNNVSGTEETHAIRHVFSMIGAVPSTTWLDRCVALDEHGFVKTGTELSREDLVQANWPLARQPLLLETSLPGVFAVGDVRAGSVKRVASSVGEGAIAVAMIHQALHH